jgi:hypothetical protein
MGRAGPVPTLVVLLFVGCACQRHNTVVPTESRAAAGRPGTFPAAEERGVRATSRGPVTALAVAAESLSFCDQGGLHEVELPSGRLRGVAASCPATGLSARAGGPEVTVRTPERGPDDVVEIEGVADSFPIEGHATDWASAPGPVVIVATATQVLHIDPAASRRTRLSSTGAIRVAVGGGWAAWWDGSAVVAHPL